MIEGFWTVVFSSGSMSGGGVVHLQDGVVTGGDGQYYYLGRYSQNNDTKTFSVTLDVRAFVNGAVTVFGWPMQQFSLQIEGRITEETAVAKGTLVQAPQISIAMQMVRRWKNIAKLY
jgi:hypothetical protein